MAWGDELPRMTNSVGRPPLPSEIKKCNRRIILYVTDEEKDLYTKRAKTKSQSVSNYIRKNLEPITAKLKELYARQETTEES